jgi:hypothetical protein
MKLPWIPADRMPECQRKGKYETNMMKREAIRMATF